MRHTGFNCTSWGSPTRSYTKLARLLTKEQFDAVVQATKLYIKSKPGRARKKTDCEGVIEIEDYDERACLHIPDGDCKSP